MSNIILDRDGLLRQAQALAEEAKLESSLIDKLLGKDHNAPVLSNKLISTVSRDEIDVFDDDLSDADQKSSGIFYQISPLIQANLPHSKQETNEYTRTNGWLDITLLAPQNPGLPYGVAPRLLLMYIFSTAKITKNKEVYLGKGLREMLQRIGITPTTGKRGSVKTYTEQLRRLASTFFTITAASTDPVNQIKRVDIHNACLFDQATLWWDDQYKNEGGTVILSDKFYSVVQESSVPLCATAIKSLQGSALALDIYCWLTYRLPRLKKATRTTWDSIMGQFGSNYSSKKTFKQNFVKSLRQVAAIYPEAKISVVENGLILHPSVSHIKALKK